MAYTALKPVRFSRNYAVGEEIPDSEVSPGMAKKLVEWGQIAPVSANAPNSGGNAPKSSENDTDGIVHADKSNAAEGQNQPPNGANNQLPENGEFTCAVCGKKFANKGALSAHEKTHERTHEKK